MDKKPKLFAVMACFCLTVMQFDFARAQTLVQNLPAAPAATERVTRNVEDGGSIRSIPDKCARARSVLRARSILRAGSILRARSILREHIKAVLSIPTPTKTLNMLLERQSQKEVLEKQM